MGRRVYYDSTGNEIGLEEDVFIEKVIINADKIRSMTDEELAGFCAHTLPFAPWCGYDKENGWCELESCEPCALQWLKQEAEGEE